MTTLLRYLRLSDLLALAVLVILGMFVSTLLVENEHAVAEVQPLPLEEQLVALQHQWRENDKMGIPNPRRLTAQADRIRKRLCKQGQRRHCPVPKAKNVDIDRLAKAVAIAETSNCTAGTGLSKNNCHGIMACSKGKCSPRKFEKTEDSFHEFKILWLTKYGDRLPTLEDAQRYAASEGTEWRKTVLAAYNRS